MKAVLQKKKKKKICLLHKHFVTKTLKQVSRFKYKLRNTDDFNLTGNNKKTPQTFNFERRNIKQNII